MFQAWLISTQGQFLELNAQNRGASFRLAGADRGGNEAPLFQGHPRSTAISQHSPSERCSRRNPHDRIFVCSPQSSQRPSAIFRPSTPTPSAHEMKAILCSARHRWHKRLPRALADFALGAIIEKEDPGRTVRQAARPIRPVRRDTIICFTPASPGQGPFFELLDACTGRRAAANPRAGRACHAMAARAIHRSAAAFSSDHNSVPERPEIIRRRAVDLYWARNIRAIR